MANLYVELQVKYQIMMAQCNTSEYHPTFLCAVGFFILFWQLIVFHGQQRCIYFFYASPSFSILPTGVPSVANCKVVSSKYIFDKVDAVTPYYVTAGTSHQEMNLFSSLMMKTRVIN